MADIVDFPQTKQHQARHLEHWVLEVIKQHPDAKVAARWERMAVQTCARFPGPPLPTRNVLELDSIAGLDTQTQNAVQQAVQEYLQSYFRDVNAQLLDVHKELLTLQKQVAEQLEADQTPKSD